MSLNPTISEEKKKELGIDKPKKDIPEKIQTIADVIQKTYEYADGVVSDSNAFFTTLPEGITKDTAKKVLNHQKDYFQATAKVTGDRALKEMEKDDSLDCVIGRFGYGGNKVEHTVFRNHSYNDPQSGGKKEAKGFMKNKFVLGGIKSTSMSLIRTSIRDQAAKIL